jgi:hypothetical protein
VSDTDPRIVKQRIKRKQKEVMAPFKQVKQDNLEEKTMKYYLTQAGFEFLTEGVPVVYKPTSSPNSIIFSQRHRTIPVKAVNITRQKKLKDVEDVARAKVIKRTEGKGLSPAQVGKRMGTASWWAGKEFIRRGGFRNG